MLQHSCYTTHRDNRYAIRHVILPYEYVKGKEDGRLRIAFSPMSSSANLLKCSDTTITRGGILHTGIQVHGVTHAVNLRDRFIRDWYFASECGVDILFGPEMLGTADLEERTSKYNKLLHRLGLEVMGRGGCPPTLTFLPSFWHEGVSSTTVVYQDGSILGVQPKYVPYVDMANHRMEALLEQEQRRLLVIHIPGVHRIVVMICADFLDIQSSETRKFICEELGATMILVPSYSQGEQDFINLLPSLKSYGTTVVWGNCCGAAKAPRVIGACSIAGTDSLVRFGSECRCGGSCKGRRSCLFLVDLPLRLMRVRPDAPQWDKPVRHVLR